MPLSSSLGMRAKNLRMSEVSRSGIARGGRGIVGLEPR
jgi:hypothetical protein